MMKTFSFLVLGLVLTLSGCGKKLSDTQHNQATLVDLNRIVSTLITVGGGKPLDTNQVGAFLASEGKSFPVPPAGKKLAVNPVTGLYEFVDQ